MTKKYGVRIARSSSLELERHPDAPRRQPWRAWAEAQKRRGPIAVDLFSGAGGLTLGLENAGYTVVLSADHDPSAVKTHLANFPGQCLDLDLSDPERVDDLVGLLEGLDVDLIAGGPPCQPFSRAGRSKIRDLVDKGFREQIDPRRELWRPFLRVIEEVMPRAVIMENVPDMALSDDMRTVRFISERLEVLGYETDMRILEAWQFGVPQHRQRLMLVALRSKVFTWPELGGQVNLRDAIGDLPLLKDTTGERVMEYSGPRSRFQERARATVPSTDSGVIFDHITRSVRPDDREAFVLMGKGARYKDLPDRLKRYRDDIFDDKYNRLSWDDCSRSITAHIAKDGYWYIHPSEPRTLTVREAARIQTFPDSFRFSGSRSDAFRQIGNAVPPVLAETVARAVLASTKQRLRKTHNRPSATRARVRSELLAWSTASAEPAWRTVGEPWDVLVGVIAGRRREVVAEVLLDAFPSPSSVVSQRISALVRTAATDRERRIVQSVGKAAAAIKREGWDEAGWATSAGLGPADRQWVEAVGLGRNHIAATAATLRVSARVMGDENQRGVGGRMLLAQLVGHSEHSSAITAALAGLGADVCAASNPRCGECPLSELCQTRIGSGGRRETKQSSISTRS